MAIDFIKIARLVKNLASGNPGAGFYKECSEILAELAKNSEAASKAMQRIEGKLDAIIIGDFKNAHHCLEQSMSSDFTSLQQFSELEKAEDLFATCYHRLSELPDCLLIRAEAAYYCGLIHLMLGRKELAGKWLCFAKNNFQHFLDQPPPKPTIVESIGNNVFKPVGNRINSSLKDAPGGVKVGSAVVFFVLSPAIAMGFLATGYAAAAGTLAEKIVTGKEPMTSQEKTALEQSRQQASDGIISINDMILVM